MCFWLHVDSASPVAEAWRGVGAELGPGPGFGATDRGAGREAFSGEGREDFRAAAGFVERPSGLSLVLVFREEELEPP